MMKKLFFKIRDICFIVKEVQCHAMCRSRYQMKTEYEKRKTISGTVR